MNLSNTIKKSTIPAIMLALCLMSGSVSIAMAEEKEALEIGGLVLVDYGSPVNNFDAQQLQLSWVELDAVVNVNPQVKGLISLLAESNLHKIRVYRAVADISFEKLPLELFLGQQIFNHGLMPTRMISNPLGYGLVLPNQPGVSAIYSMGDAKIGVAGLMTEAAVVVPAYKVVTTAGDTIEILSEQRAGARSMGGIVTIDYSFLNGSTARLSSFVSRDIVDADIACDLIIGKLYLDGELFSQINVPIGGTKAASYLIGAAYDVTDNISVALRHDGISVDQFKDLSVLVGAGVVAKVFGDCFVAFEYDYNKPYQADAVSSISLDFGLKSTLKLPGFQRKTLTRE